MKKIVFILALLILYTPIFSQIGYEVSSIYTEKSDGGTENSQNTAYFIKNKNILKKYYAENDRIRKEIEIQVLEGGIFGTKKDPDIVLSFGCTR